MSSSVVYALDFDGVICDSVGESSETGILAAKSLWPNLQFDQDASGRPALWLLNAMRAVRPVIETGFENVLLARLLSEIDEASVQKSFVDPVLDDWPELREETLEKWGESKERLVEIFGSTRDLWIEQDVDAWIGANRMFPGVVDALNFASAPLYIITTKQTRFCQLLLERYGVKSVPNEHIFGYGTGSKISVLKKILAMPKYKGKTICFVEDRYETLEAVSISMLGQPLDLYLASWGYNTKKTRNVADKHPFIKLLDLPTFASKLQ